MLSWMILCLVQTLVECSAKKARAIEELQAERFQLEM
jgi:hypothetical protein